MARMIVARLRWRAGRAAALLLGVLLATTGFTVLTGSTATSRLTVQGTVSEHARGAYDILVRPHGARTALEEQRGLVRANFLAGQYGGITAAQWHQITDLPGVEVAAPIAMLGYVTTRVGAGIAVDVTDVVDPDLQTQIIRVRTTWRGDRGLSTAADPDPSFVYVTKRPLVFVKKLPGAMEDVLYTDGVYRPQNACGPGGQFHLHAYEVQPDGRTLPLCFDRFLLSEARSRAQVGLASLTPQGTFVVSRRETPRLIAHVQAPIAQLAAAIDPTAEAALTGLDSAIINGHYLPDLAPPTMDKGFVPVLLASDPYLDERADPIAERIDNPGLAGHTGADLTRIVTAKATVSMPAQGQAVQDLYRRSVTATGTVDRASVNLQSALRAEAVTYDVDPDGTLRPRPVPQTAADALRSPGDESGRPMPWLAMDTAQRATSPALPKLHVIGTPVGVFNRDQLNVGPELGTPLETYAQSSAVGADERSLALLGDQPLLPTSNIGGYLVTSPTVLMSLSALWRHGGAADAISAIRVRVAGVTGFDSLSREKVRLVAQDIAAITGLDVEVMLGASGAPQTIALPAGRYGRPDLTLAELWSKKGVAAAIVQAIDRKSVILFGLILIVCVLFLTNAAAAAVRSRSTELAVLACLGWSRRRLAGLFLGEVALLGGLAGMVSAALARPLGAAVDIEVSASRAWLAVPVALSVCLLAAAVPTRRASQAHPAAAVHRPVSPPGRFGARRHYGIAGLALANLRRTPGRTALGAAALAVGIAGLTLLTAVTWAFHGTITGTLLGDAISVRVRGVDVLAVVATVIIAALAVADVLYLNVRDRAAEFAALRATGWSDAALARLIAYEGLGLGLIGAVLGAGAGIGAAMALTSQPTDRLWWSAAITISAGLLLALTAAVIPAVLQRRMPMSNLLAEE